MALTQERLRETRQALRDDESLRWRVILGVAWAVLLPLGLALEPAAAASAQPWWGVIISLALFGAVIATGVGLARARPWGIGASLLASLIFATGVFACPATGHHAFGLWWIGEFAASLALVGLSTAAYFRRRA
jgi:hypothetical protein